MFPIPSLQMNGVLVVPIKIHWTKLEEIACPRRHPTLSDLKASVVKAARAVHSVLSVKPSTFGQREIKLVRTGKAVI